MTIAKTGNRAQYTGDGTTVAFAYGFRFFDATDLGVYVLSTSGVETKKVLTTDYTVSNTGNESGGTVTFNTAPATGEIVTILGEIPQTQGIDLNDNDSFPAETLERGLDRAVRLIQRVDEELNRSLVLPVSTTLSGVTLPAPQANTAIGWNAAGNNLANIFLLDNGTPVVGTTDNGLMRYDIATQGLQDSGVIVDDSDNVTGVVNFAMTGTFTLGGTALTATAAELNVLDGVTSTATELNLLDGALDHATAAWEAGTATEPGVPSPADVKAAIDALAGGKVLKFAETSTGAVATGTTLIPYDDTIPQITEGDEYLSLAFTPTSASSNLLIEAVVHAAVSTGGFPAVAIFEAGTSDAIGASFFPAQVSVDSTFTTVARVIVSAGSTSARTYKVRAGTDRAGTFTVNGRSGGRLLGGKLISSLTVTEIAT